ncbi:hypothetical protein QLX08_005638 [Tetragonisca angustula]|uniref:CCDC174 alpha/beta GRSR domain-containing protein n=1 Tax=Tetragonisca angustula TaxID=166442 RepID=A0AAW0ZX94_9HYME
MNNTKKINVNFSSLVGLKAELLKKQHEVNEARLKSEINHTTPKLQRKKPKKIEEESKKENSKIPEYIEDVNMHKKSKLMLEAKARLYERLKKSRTINENFLVDFTNKSDESEEEPLPKDETDAVLENEDDWVEYEDCFGRTRKCLREDLPLMQEKDQLIKQQIINKKGIDPKTNDAVDQNYVEEEKEPEIEIMRRKWEEQTQKLADKVNIHYQDILFDEARTHGVGYYAFSQDEEERVKQQENLFNLRKETERKQREINELKELRQKMEHNRLKAAKIRQRIRAGLPIDMIEEELREKNDSEYSQNASESMHNTEENLIKVKETKRENNDNQTTEKSKELEKENKIKALGELLGKRKYWYEMSQEEWVQKCRKMRVNEFGPVYENFKSAGYLNSENADIPLSVHNDINSHPYQQDGTENEIDIHSYDIPLPPGSSTSTNDSNTGYNSVIETINQSNSTSSIDLGLYKSSNIVQNQMKQNRSIDEASITAGLKYLREKFEKNQNT